MSTGKSLWPVLLLAAILPGWASPARAGSVDSGTPRGGPTPAPAGVIAQGPQTWNRRRAGFWKSREADKGAVVFVGDSIIQGWSRMVKDFPRYKVANRGIAGDTTAGVKFRLQEDVLDLDPRAIVIMIGVNDFRISRRSPSDAARNLEGILDAIAGHKADLPVVLCLLMPTGGGAWAPITEYNDATRKMAEERSNVTLCDTFTPFADRNGGCRVRLTRDRLHPNAAGYALWKKTIDPILQKALSIEARPQRAGPTPAPGGVIAWGPEIWNQRRAEFWKSRDADRGAIVFVGDSITQAWSTLTKDFRGVKVANRGIAGDTTAGVKFRLREDVLDLDPRAIVIMIGVNDFRISRRSPSDAARKLEEILDAIAGHDADLPVVLCLVMPTGGGAWAPITGYNETIRKMGEERPSVTLCDTFTPFADENGGCQARLSGDRLHPNAAGYALWQKTLVPALREALSKKRGTKTR